VGDTAFSDDDIALFTALVPHLIRASEVHHRLWELDLRDAFTRAEIDSRRYGVIVVDVLGHIVSTNDIGTRLMEAPGGLCLESGALSVVDRHQAKTFRRLIRGCSHPSATRKDGPGGSLVLRRPQRSPLHILVTPFPNQQRSMNKLWHMPGPPAAIILITDPDRQRNVRKVQLRKRFGLTSAEADLTLEILKGDGRAAAASRLGISPGTARTHLQRVFHKTGVHRQAELVGVIRDLGQDESEM
jgi:DNA-binding CsgD family transcriptional regulator